MKRKNKRKALCEFYLKKINKVDFRFYIDQQKILGDSAGKLREILNPIRLNILILTRDHEIPVCVLVEILNLDQSLISHHIAVLKKNGFLLEKRVGKFRLYKANNEKISSLLNTFLDLFINSR